MADASSTSLSVTSRNGGAHRLNPPRGPAATVPPVREDSEHKYYCTCCENLSRFNVEVDWWKHERASVSNYVCMLNGATEVTPRGITCAFCGWQDPPEGHLSAHDIRKRTPELSGPFSCKTRKDMHKHLSEAHHAKPPVLFVNKWKVTRTVWSCGFCVITLSHWATRLSHIALHFARGQTIDKWDTTKVIQGLLQQSNMIKAWECKTASLPREQNDCRFWKKHATKALQRNLEIGPSSEKSAMDLANAALAASKVDIRNWAEMLGFTNPDVLGSDGMEELIDDVALTGPDFFGLV